MRSQIHTDRLVEDCVIDSSNLHSVRSPSWPWKGASSVPNAGERRCWISVPGATSRQVSPIGNPAPPMTQSTIGRRPIVDVSALRILSIYGWMSCSVLTEREQFESTASSFIRLHTG